jgi:hypothetical protein
VESIGPPDWGLGMVLTTPPCKTFLVTEPHKRNAIWICEVTKVLQELQSHGGGGEMEEHMEGDIPKTVTVQSQREEDRFWRVQTTL